MATPTLEAEMPEEGDEVRAFTANPQYAGRYQGSLEDAEKKGQCPFCKPDRQAKALYEIDGWFVDYNPYPAVDREGGHPTYHLLFICKEHKTDAFSLKERDWDAINLLLEVCRNHFGFTGGGMCWRFGNPEESGATVLHLHFHCIVPRRAESMTLRFIKRITPQRIEGAVLRGLKIVAPRIFAVHTVPVDFPVG